jgi:hypothetical protein
MVRFHALHDSRRHKPAFLAPPHLKWVLYRTLTYVPSPARPVAVPSVFRLLLVVCVRLFPQAPLVVPFCKTKKIKHASVPLASW